MIGHKYQVKDLITELQACNPEAVILTGYYQDYTILGRGKTALDTESGSFPYSKGISGEELFEEEGLRQDQPYVNLIG